MIYYISLHFFVLKNTLQLGSETWVARIETSNEGRKFPAVESAELELPCVCVCVCVRAVCTVQFALQSLQCHVHCAVMCDVKSSLFSRLFSVVGCGS